VLVVDDHSSDATVGIVHGMTPTWYGLRLIELHSGMGKKAAISRGVQEARGDVVLVTDADARCGPLRLARLAGHWNQHRPALLLMPVLTTGGAGMLAWMQRKEQAALQAAAIGAGLAGRPVLANGANMAFDRNAFHAIRGFEGDRWASGDDMFLLQRMKRQGRTVSYLSHPDVLVQVAPEASFMGFLQQRLRWAGKMRAYRDAFGLLAAMAAALFPLALLLFTAWAVRHVQFGQGLFHIVALLTASWAFWTIPVLRLVSGYEKGYAGQGRSKVDGPWSTLPALLLFMLYAPMIAILAIFVRPTWKGRRT
jgi:cellulose synthase/poly-beta-1,6-N-acetylglucosamine synthase-like glycosyltransferase